MASWNQAFPKKQLTNINVDGFSISVSFRRKKNQSYVVIFGADLEKGNHLGTEYGVSCYSDCVGQPHSVKHYSHLRTEQHPAKFEEKWERNWLKYWQLNKKTQTSCWQENLDCCKTPSKKPFYNHIRWLSLTCNTFILCSEFLSNKSFHSRP